MSLDLKQKMLQAKLDELGVELRAEMVFTKIGIAPCIKLYEKGNEESSKENSKENSKEKGEEVLSPLNPLASKI